MTPHPSDQAPRASVWRPIVWRGLAPVLAFLAGWVGMLAGAGVTERDLAASGLAEQAYYAVGLFFLGGLDIGTPTGGPLYARVLLWSAYVVAPLITASAVVEAALRLVSPLALRLRPLKDHVVLGGAGRLTMTYVGKLRRTHPRRTVVVVERDPNHPALGALRDMARVVVVTGDITHSEVLQRVGVHRAHRLLFLTGDDFVNLDAAAKVLRDAPHRAGRIVVHMSNLAFMQEAEGSSVSRDCEIFNGHQFAAMHLVQEHLLGRFNSTEDLDIVVLGGFGRFGMTVLHELQQHARGSFGHVVIIDEDATKKTRAFEDQPGFAPDYRRSVIDGDLLDPGVWRSVGDLVRSDGRSPVFIIGSGNDGTNLHAALLVRKQHPAAYVIIRSFRASPFTAEIAHEVGIEAFHLSGLIESGMPDSWF